jgi:hypothetical protein
MIEDEKVQKFLQWCDEKGIIKPKLQWPVAFGSEAYPY